MIIQQDKLKKNKNHDLLTYIRKFTIGDICVSSDNEKKIFFYLSLRLTST